MAGATRLQNRALLEAAAADLAELHLEATRAELIPAEAVRVMRAQHLQHVRAELMQEVRRILPALAAERDPVACEAMLRAAFLKALDRTQPPGEADEAATC